MSHAAIQVDQRLRLKLAQIDGPELRVQLTRRTAQTLASVLRQFCGAEVRSAGLGASATLAAEVVEDSKPNPKPGVVRLR